MPPKTIGGFKIIPLRFAETSSSQHELYLKEHVVRNKSDDKPEDRTLFVLNVPPYVTEDSFKRIFSCVGRVNNVIFQDKANVKDTDVVTNASGFKVAFIVFEKSSSVEKALNLTTLEPLSSPEHPVLTGVQKWAKEYNDSISNHSQLEREVISFMAEYDKNEKKRKQQEKQANDGGWTVVTKKGRNPGLSRKESLANKLLEKTNKGDKKKQLDDFYTFQKRESKMKHLVEMRKKYELDKKKVEAMKQARRFKPF